MSALDHLNRSGLDMLAEPDFAWLESYWNDPFFQANAVREVEQHRAECHAAINAGMAGLNAKQAARWEAEAGA